MATVEEAVEASSDGWARDALGRRSRPPTARPACASTAITVRCLVGGDGGLPSGEDDPDALAYVGRAY